jgi:hypothetical protein
MFNGMYVIGPRECNMNYTSISCSQSNAVLTLLRNAWITTFSSYNIGVGLVRIQSVMIGSFEPIVITDTVIRVRSFCSVRELHVSLQN